MLQWYTFPLIDDNRRIVSGDSCDSVLALEIDSYGVKASPENVAHPCAY
jgi:hypothetical protein